MTSITRRDALMGATAAAITTTAITAPLAIKAAGVKAALGGNDAHLERLSAEWQAAESRHRRRHHGLAGRRLGDLEGDRLRLGAQAR